MSVTFAIGLPQNFSFHELRHWLSQNGYGRLLILRSRVLLHADVPGTPNTLDVRSNIGNRIAHRLQYLLRVLVLFHPVVAFDDDSSFPC